MKPGSTRRQFVRRTTEAAALVTAATAPGEVASHASEKPATIRLASSAAAA